MTTLPSRLLRLPPTLRVIAAQRTMCSPAPQAQIISSNSRPFSTTLPKLQDAASSPSPESSSVSHTEISHFNALASSWWDPQGSSRLLHLMNPLRHKFIQDCGVHTTNAKLRYLDVGCGGGIFAESAARLHNTESVTAIDPSSEVIAVAKRHRRQDPLLLEEGRLGYENIAIEDLPRPSSPHSGFDVISLFEVIEHIRQPTPFLETCLRHLKPGGWLIGSTIARTNTSWFTTKFMAEDVLGLVPRGTHDWKQYISPNELEEWAKVQPELARADEGGWNVMGVVYVPGLGWKEVKGSEDWGNYFFGVRKRVLEKN